MPGGSPQPRRIVHLVSSLDGGGIENGLLRLLPRLDPTRFAPALVCIKRTGTLVRAFADQGIPVHHLRCHWHVPHPWSVWKLKRLLHDLRADVIHAHTVEPSLYASAAGPGARARVILAHFHNLNPAPLRLQCPAERRAALRRTATLHASQTVQNAYEARLGSLPGVHRVLPWATLPDPLPSLPDRARLRQDLDLPSDRRLLLCLARLGPGKGHGDLLCAFRQVLRADPEALLLLAGDGPLRGELECLAGQLEIKNSVRFLGFVPDPFPLLHLADLHVLASPKEGFPGAVLEAMGVGTPQVLTASGGAEELVGESGAAVLVPPRNPEAMAQAIGEFLKSPDKIGHAAAAGRERAKNFTIDVLCRELQKIYEI